MQTKFPKFFWVYVEKAGHIEVKYYKTSIARRTLDECWKFLQLMHEKDNLDTLLMRYDRYYRLESDIPISGPIQKIDIVITEQTEEIRQFKLIPRMNVILGGTLSLIEQLMLNRYMYKIDKLLDKVEKTQVVDSIRYAIREIRLAKENMQAYMHAKAKIAG